MEQTPLERAEARNKVLEKALREACQCLRNRGACSPLVNYDPDDMADAECPSCSYDADSGEYDCTQCWATYLLRQAEGGDNE